MDPSTFYERASSALPSELATRFTPETFTHLQDTASTNDDLREGLSAGTFAPDHVVVAEHQTKGRGRRGDKWEAPPGKNLLFSLAHRLPADQTRWPLLPLLTGECVARSCASLLDSDTRVEIKWPNDIYLNDKKAAGILVETVMTPTPCAIIGIGINVNLQLSDLPSELQNHATSLREELGCQSSIAFLLGLTLSHLYQIDLMDAPSILCSLDWIRSHDWLSGKGVHVTLPDGSFLIGEARGFADRGALIVEDSENAFHQVVSAEKVTVLGSR